MLPQKNTDKPLNQSTIANCSKFSSLAPSSCCLSIIKSRNLQTTIYVYYHTNWTMTSANSIASGTASSGGNGIGVNNKHNVFVYGSLLADDVVSVLLHRVPQNSPAVLHGYHRFSIKGRVYPAILPIENKKVIGRVLLDITSPELDILDKFEDFEYEKRLVDVCLLDTSDILQAYTYVWVNSDDPDLYGEWDFEVWKQSKMKDFVNMTVEFVEEQELPESKPRVATYESYYNQDDG